MIYDLDNKIQKIDHLEMFYEEADSTADQTDSPFLPANKQNSFYFYFCRYYFKFLTINTYKNSR